MKNETVGSVAANSAAGRRTRSRERRHRNAGKLAAVRIQQPDGELGVSVTFRGEFRRDLRRSRSCRDAASASLPFVVLEGLRPVRDLEKIQHNLTLLRTR